MFYIVLIIVRVCWLKSLVNTRKLKFGYRSKNLFLSHRGLKSKRQKKIQKMMTLQFQKRSVCWIKIKIKKNRSVSNFQFLPRFLLEIVLVHSCHSAVC